jgi:hypothetical protein
MFTLPYVPSFVSIVYEKFVRICWCEGSKQHDPCDKRPCTHIARAIADSCQGVNTDDFTCRCEATFLWNDATNSCGKTPETDISWCALNGLD